MYYIIYKTTNNINEKIYIGKHKTNNLKDGYYGSGTILKLAIEKYGIENFSVEILHYLNSEEEMNSKEEEIVNENFVRRDDNYNIAVGGNGGFYLVNKEGRNHLHNNRENSLKNLELGNDVFIKKLGDIEFREKWIKAISDSWKEKYKNGYKSHWIKRKHSEESKKKIGEANSIKQKGEKNSQFGSVWIYNLEEKISKKIKKDELPTYENLGWLKGRKMKF